MNLKNIGNNVKKFRLLRGLTQAQLAEIAEISTVHMSHIETGSVAMSLDSLLNISAALDVTPDSILLGEYRLSPDGASVLMKEYASNLTSDENLLILEIAELLDKIKVNRK